VKAEVPLGKALTKAQAKKPELRAATLTVVPTGKGSYVVAGEHKSYRVYDRPAERLCTCTCKAGLNRVRCAHVIALQHFLSKDSHAAT
jgi:hypothetical protein